MNKVPDCRILGMPVSRYSSTKHQPGRDQEARQHSNPEKPDPVLL